MQTRLYTVRFHTPAFLGDAQRSGRWRTPPFKAQLRQWWRVAYAAQQQYRVNVGEMRDIEGHLFGHAWLENDRDEKGEKVAARRSEVRVRLSQWDAGTLKTWEPLASVAHREVKFPVGSDLYMGYGALVLEKGARQPTLQANAAIQAKESAQLAIAFPEAAAPLMAHALQLMHLYGTVGGRSRNAWGSYSLIHTADSNSAISAPRTLSTRALADCLKLDWPHALGADAQGPLVWQTQPLKDWAGVMKTLAQIKIALRTQFVFTTGKTQSPEDRHWLSYPVTNHSVASWGNNARLPNQLRFKVRSTTNGLVGVVFHMPHQPPADFRPQPQTLDRIWRQVHSHLDQSAALKRTTA
jgi:CRISPR-associated protein Cmr1